MCVCVVWLWPKRQDPASYLQETTSAVTRLIILLTGLKGGGIQKQLYLTQNSEHPTRKGHVILAIPDLLCHL